MDSNSFIYQNSASNNFSFSDNNHHNTPNIMKSNDYEDS